MKLKYCCLYFQALSKDFYNERNKKKISWYRINNYLLFSITFFFYCFAYIHNYIYKQLKCISSQSFLSILPIVCLIINKLILFYFIPNHRKFYTIILKSSSFNLLSVARKFDLGKNLLKKKSECQLTNRCTRELIVPRGIQFTVINSHNVPRERGVEGQSVLSVP